MRVHYLVPVFGILAACQTTVPDSGAGFNTASYQAQREAELAGQSVTGDPLAPPSAISSETLVGYDSTGAPITAANPTPGVSGTGTSVPATGSAEDIARETAYALQQSQGNSGVAPVQANPSNPAPQMIDNAGISDENDFNAVSSRQSIESDAQRIAQNRANYQQVAPTAVPERSGSAQPNIVQYALSTSHPKGTKVHSRAGFNLQAKAQRNCAGFASPDLAQIAFLEGGGPQRDRKGLDPDGDGYACSWDPSPYRSAVNN
ncbi:hypothetical protein M3P21_06685 [Ruegeria sp. 2012CJ41-6]|uniref:Excalibur calcium-binding domain-containing protein n=1 Tax=Ruegeria spongiae TaxID=2942209 RepID=A0ABT0Q051_9RHOB|nr:hypothetical protein [Ruegeria spongiae]MCL6283215.1 hypothetical protein [Ruegeria spongiae]